MVVLKHCCYDEAPLPHPSVGEVVPDVLAVELAGFGGAHHPPVDLDGHALVLVYLPVVELELEQLVGRLITDGGDDPAIDGQPQHILPRLRRVFNLGIVGSI